MKYARLILKNLIRNKRRSLLTVLSISVSLFIFSALMSLPAVARQVLSSTASSERVVCHNKAGLTYSLPENYKQKILAQPHVEAAVSWGWFGGIYREPTDQFPNFAVDHEDFDKVFSDWGVSAEGLAEFKKLRTACLVGPATMKRFGWQVGQEITLKGTVYPINISCKIVGVTGEKSPPSILFFRRDYLEEAIGRKGFVSTIWIKVDKAGNIPAVIAGIDETFANAPEETQTEAESSFIGNFLSSYQTIFQFAELLGIIVVITIGLVAANTASMTIRERRGEIAVMRSMGFSSRVILSCLLSECFLVGLAGGLIGCGAGYLLFRILSVGAAALGPFSLLRMPPSVLIESLVLAGLIGILSGFFPARSAARQSIVDVLRVVA